MKARLNDKIFIFVLLHKETEVQARRKIEEKSLMILCKEATLYSIRFLCRGFRCQEGKRARFSQHYNYAEERHQTVATSIRAKLHKIEIAVIKK